MAITKSTKKPSTKVGRKVAGTKLKKASSKLGKVKVTKTTKRALKSTSTKRVALKSKAMLPSKKFTAKTSGIKKVASPIKGVDFVAGILKQATKAQKVAISQCKALSKQVNNLKKQYEQLSKKQSTVKGRSLQALEKQLSKIKIQVTIIRTSLLKAENNKDKIITLVDFVSNINARATS